MKQSLDQFVDETRRILKAKPGPPGLIRPGDLPARGWKAMTKISQLGLVGKLWKTGTTPASCETPGSAKESEPTKGGGSAFHRPGRVVGDIYGATVFHLTGSRQARADLRIRWQGGTGSRVRARLGRNGARSLRVPWSCARVGMHRYSLTVRDRYGNSRTRSGSFRTESCVGLRGFFIWPLHGFITSYFGYAERGRLHDGIDIDDNRSSVIRAAAWGRVTSAGWSDGYGNLTVIDHGEGFITFYGHQSRILVHSGQQVSRDQVIGHVGCTGSCTGTHLHFGMHVHGAPVNPLRYLRR